MYDYPYRQLAEDNEIYKRGWDLFLHHLKPAQTFFYLELNDFDAASSHDLCSAILVKYVFKKLIWHTWHIVVFLKIQRHHFAQEHTLSKHPLIPVYKDTLLLDMCLVVEELYMNM